MIERYTWAPWTLADQYRLWTRIELEVLAGQVELGIVPNTGGVELVIGSYQVDPNGTLDRVVDDQFVEAVATQEERTRHDVVAFLDVLRHIVGGDAGQYLHLGMTSSDLVDTAWAIRWRELSYELYRKTHETMQTIVGLRNRPDSYMWIPGRTHGELAAPLQWRSRLWLWRAELARAAVTINEAHHSWSAGKLSGPVGTHSQWVTPELEKLVLGRLGVYRSIWSSQTVPRDVRVRQATSMYGLVAACESIATQIRLGTAVDEIRLHRGSEVVGSSSMPGKVNPVELEKICGLARIARGDWLAVAESQANWWERDISASSVDRLALQDLVQISGHVLDVLQRVLQNEIELVGVEQAEDLPEQVWAYVRKNEELTQ